MSTRSRSGGVGFFSRIKTGWTLTRDSARVIRHHPKLVAFPLLAAAFSAFFFVLLFVPLVVTNLIGFGLEYVVLFVLYFVTTFFSTYFSSALVYAANEAIHGREPHLVESLKVVSDRLGPILVWSLVSATVSVLLKVLEESDNPIASVLRSVFAVAWSIMTFFIVPVIVFEDVTVTSMFTRSAAMFRNTWGETIGAGFGVTFFVAVVGVVLVLGALAISVPLALVFPLGGFLVGAILVGAALATTYLLGQTIWGIAKTALYVYAVEGERPSEFENFDFETLGGRAERSASPGASGTPDRWTGD